MGGRIRGRIGAAGPQASGGALRAKRSCTNASTSAISATTADSRSPPCSVKAAIGATHPAKNQLRPRGRCRRKSAAAATPSPTNNAICLVIGLGIDSIPLMHLWKGALVRSTRSTVSVYDTLFVEFPEVARRPKDLLDGAAK